MAGPQNNPDTERDLTLEDARQELRRCIIEVTANLRSIGPSRVAGVAAWIRDIAATYTALGGDLELGAGADPNAGTPLADVVDAAATLVAAMRESGIRHREDFPPRLQPLVGPLNDLDVAVRRAADA